MGFSIAKTKREQSYSARKWAMKVDPLVKGTPFHPTIPFKLGNAMLVIFWKNVVEDVILTKEGAHALIILQVKHAMHMLLITLKSLSLALVGMARREHHVEV